MADTRINVAVAGPYNNLFTYKIRSDETTGLTPGCRFLVPFGKSLKIAFFVEKQNSSVDYRLRYVKERIDSISPFPPYLFELCRWVSDYYFAGLGETLAAALPGSGTRKPKLEYTVVDKAYLQIACDSEKTEGVLAAKLLRRKSVSEKTLIHDRESAAIVREWLARGIITPRYRTASTRKKALGYRLLDGDQQAQADKLEHLKKIRPDMIYSRQQLLTEFGFTAYQITKLCKDETFQKVFDESGVTELSTYPIRYGLPGLNLLEGQQKALDQIIPAIDNKRFEPFMLFGITGSGKTLVYCHAAQKAVESGQSVLVMVPEIALSGMLLSSFAAFFGDRVAVIHSGLTVAQRQAVRQKIASGDIKVVIGPRSAIFAPLSNPGLIIVDEEHDPSYKQDDPAPRYHGRDVAVMLASKLSCPIILGSASPSIESYHNAVTGRYKLLTLDQRPKSGYVMPEIITLDMKREKISGDCSFLSYKLKKETETRIADGGQVIYYLNRRGFSPRLKCRDCGEAPSCDDCGVTLTYHRAGQTLKCHFCDRVEPAPDRCPRCGGNNFIYVGAGTQRVEENLARLFADIRAERIDSDKAATKSGRLILGDFAGQKFDLLVGTQMVTKGLDIPGVTLVGVLAADIGLDMPDFRAEKTYARLLQVAGRAGRGDREGLVLIQTYYSDHPVIRFLSEGNYPDFYDSVLADRHELSYPPFSRLINITLTSDNEKELEAQSLAFRIKLEERLAGVDKDNKKKAGYRLLGPSKAPMYKLRGVYRRRLIIKCASVQKVVRRFKAWEKEEKNFGLSSKIKPIFDIDPMNMM